MDGNYHKGVRMNAVVLTGLLNDREGDSRNVPVPSKAAFSQLSKEKSMQVQVPGPSPSQ